MKGKGVFAVSPWAKLHLPLPRTPRQSQQLLNALTSSFRRQLDREYPSPAPSPKQEPTNNQSGNGDRSAHNSHSSAHATDKHLRTILDNPLFSVVPSKPAFSGGRRAVESDELIRLAKEPMIVLDELVASGSVTMPGLAQCLKSQLLLTSHYDGQELVKALSESKAGSKVVSWWYASDSETRKLLFQSPATLYSLVKFMAAEGLHETVYDWFGMLARCDIGGHDGRIPERHARLVFRSLLIRFLEAEMHYGQGLTSAMRCYTQVCKAQISTGGQLLGKNLGATLMKAGNILCQSLGNDTYDRAKAIPPATYDEFVDVISTMGPKSLLCASMYLYHPTQPDAKPFLYYVDHLLPSEFQNFSDQKKGEFFRQGFDALRVLIDQGNLRDSSYLARFMQQNSHSQRDAAASSGSGYRPSPQEELSLSRLNLSLT